MRELFDAQLNLDDKPLTLRACGNKDGADVCAVTDRIDSAALSKTGDRLKLIANYGNGRPIDVTRPRSVAASWTNAPGVLTEDTPMPWPSFWRCRAGWLKALPF
jgi:glyoxylate reductase